MVRATKHAAPRRGGDTEHRILEAAHKVFVRRGTAGARLQEIADEAGVNKALLHYYFRNKSRLSAAVFQSIARQMLPRGLEVLASDLGVEDKVRAVVALMLDQLSRAPYAPAYVLSELNQHPERVSQFIHAAFGIDTAGALPQLRRTLGRQLKQRARAGTLRAIPLEQFIVNLQALCLFPFVARPMLSALLQLDAAGFNRLIEERKRQLPLFFLDALRP